MLTTAGAVFLTSGERLSSAGAGKRSRRVRSRSMPTGQHARGDPADHGRERSEHKSRRIGIRGLRAARFGHVLTYPSTFAFGSAPAELVGQRALPQG